MKLFLIGCLVGPVGSFLLFLLVLMWMSWELHPERSE